LGRKRREMIRKATEAENPPTDIPDSILRIACARTIRVISVVATGRHDVRASSSQIVTGGISLAAVDAAKFAEQA
jgi:hypothetical protein